MSRITVGDTEKSKGDSLSAENSPVPDDPSETPAALRKTIAELRSALKSRDEFISMLVHEVRNPLTPLVMQVNSLLRWTQTNTLDTARIQRGVRMLNSIVDHLMRRTAVLLDVSRMSSGLYRLELSDVNASAVISAVVLG